MLSNTNSWQIVLNMLHFCLLRGGIIVAINEIKLSESVNSVIIDATTADILIFPDNVEAPIVRTTGEIDIKERDSEAVIKEKQSIINGESCIINGDNSFITINNSQIISGNIFNGTTVNLGEKSNIELIVPKKTQIETFMVDAKSGNLTIEELIFARLVVQTISGNITLNDIDLLFAKLKTISGDIDAKILESIINYRTYLKSISGKTIQDSVETVSPTLLSEKHELVANSISGDINILFKGKR